MNAHTVLVAEDDPALLNSMRIRLRGEGYNVLCASDAYQAVALAREHRPDMLILDVNMPAGDGFSVQGRVQKVLGRVPVVYVTGDQSDAVLERSQNLGARSILRKPFDTAELLDIVRESLDQRDAEEIN